MSPTPSNIPSFDDLPPVKDMPQGCAWGLFDKDGQKDNLGCLNLLTPTVVQEALKEATTGHSISLNWPLNALHKAAFMRAPLTHRIVDGQELVGFHAYDDEVAFNTQSSSQWDSLVHFAHQESGCYYNGVKPTKEHLLQEFGNGDEETARAIPTLNHWHTRGGLVARGVLLDYKTYAHATGIEYSPFTSHAISVADLEAVAKYQNTDFKFGDVLIVRTGYTDEMSALSAEEQEEKQREHRCVGVAGDRGTARWVWDRHFSAVACDAVGFEVMPPKIEEDGGRVGGPGELVLHQWFLSLFGLNIGELWDLKALGEHCLEVGKYSFLLTSIPLNVPGAVGSPANALAIF
ncbi:hypothetical protein K402DRAFT_323434 [Aulographum hederae CBS 113979]|uniref:Cyclase n=1 Tax=Aulographum hederae CBS 113979 TaxID=1176131 RepID=A0A6G1HD72_9PEZI|nr:hypothetical protein K402DRAFT_323434 [Aulographum hederae CBS 113979]